MMTVSVNNYFIEYLRLIFALKKLITNLAEHPINFLYCVTKMEEEKVIQEEKRTQKFHTGITESISHLMNIIEMSFSSVTIKTEDGQIVGTLPEPLCMIFGYFETMKFSSFKDSNAKTLTLPFCEEYSKLFVSSMQKLFTNDLALSGKQCIMLLKIFDTLIINEDIGESFYSSILKNIYNYREIINQIIIECSGKNQGPFMKRIFEHVIKEYNFILEDATSTILTYSLGRNQLMKELKSDTYFCINETDLFLSIITKISKINKKSDFKISFKAFLDLMACVRWFHVDEREVQKKMHEIKELYPEFEYSNTMSSCFERRKLLVQKYGIHNKLKFFKYSDKFQKLDCRNCVSYERNVSAIGGRVMFYTTTRYPIPFSLTFETKLFKMKGLTFLVVSSDTEITDMGDLVILIDVSKNNKLLISQRWTFKNGKKLHILTHDSDTSYKVVLRLAYFDTPRKL